MTTKVGIELTARDTTSSAFAAVDKRLSGLQGSADRIRNIFAGVGGVLSAGAFFAFARSSITSAAALDDMAEATGATVEGLSKLVDVARISGGGIDTVTTAITALNRSLLNPQAEENKGVGSVLKALNLNVAELLRLEPDKRLEKVAQAFAQFADGAGKGNAAQVLFKRSVQEVMPFLNDLNENLSRGASVTAEQAKRAEELEKAWGRLSLTITNTGRSWILESISGWSKLIDKVKEYGIVTGSLKAFRPGASAGDTEPEVRSRIEKLKRDAETAKDDKSFREIDKQIDEAQDRLYEILRTKPPVQLPPLEFTAPPRDEPKAARAQIAKLSELEKFQKRMQTDRLSALDEEGEEAQRLFVEKMDAERALATFKAAAHMEELARTRELDEYYATAGEETMREFRAADDIRRAKDAFDDLAKSGKTSLEELKDAIDGWARDATQAFVDFAFGAEQSVGDMITNIVKQFAGMQLQKHVFGPIFEGLGTVIGGLLKHDGGIMGMDGGGTRSVSALAYAGAPRFHGGFMPDEYPAILQRGEGVFTPAQMRALGGGAQSVRVEIKNEGTPQRVVSAQPSFDPAGLVVSVVTRDLAINGPISQAMGGQFGLRR